jgi:L,D-transpeptidase ErfK/SrfK
MFNLLIAGFSKTLRERVVAILVLVLVIGCSSKKNSNTRLPVPETDSISSIEQMGATHSAKCFIKIKKDIQIKDYFSFLDSLTSQQVTLRNPQLNEYAIVHANPWILDSLKNTDYYVLKKKGIFSYNQPRIVIIHKGDSLVIPDSSSVSLILKKLKTTVLDLNIPEYTLRIIQANDTILQCKVRVGRNDKEYLELAKHIVDLKTHIGEGEIIRVERNPIFINPDTGKRYDSTQRDDGNYTKLPIIPWIEPTLNGKRYGDLIHPTTNISTLGKAYSPGCVGASEADAWIIYYNSPIGTRVIFRYNLMVINHGGDTINLPDIYQLETSSAKRKNY